MALKRYHWNHLYNQSKIEYDLMEFALKEEKKNSWHNAINACWLSHSHSLFHIIITQQQQSILYFDYYDLFLHVSEECERNRTLVLENVIRKNANKTMSKYRWNQTHIKIGSKLRVR